jgi:hypothetical protein
MSDTDKIVAAILAAAYSFKFDTSIGNAGDVVKLYDDMLEAMDKSARTKAEAKASANAAAELTAREKYRKEWSDKPPDT